MKWMKVDVTGIHVVCWLFTSQVASSPSRTLRRSALHIVRWFMMVGGRCRPRHLGTRHSCRLIRRAFAAGKRQREEYSVNTLEVQHDFPILFWF